MNENLSMKHGAVHIVDSGYEWLKQGEENWYRPIGSKDEWIKFEIDAE